MRIDNLKEFVNWAWGYICDESQGEDVFPSDWERDDTEVPVPVQKAFDELEVLEGMQG